MTRKDISELSDMEYHVMLNKGTEPPHSHDYNLLYKSGTYHCKLCGQALFESAHKFDAGCGWPSFYAEYGHGNINIHQDFSHGMVREEITCSNCDSHLGHVFPDGPAPTGLRYCVNGISLLFKEEKE